jgi:lipid-binding SYLF domain-containing protein
MKIIGLLLGLTLLIAGEPAAAEKYLQTLRDARTAILDISQIPEQGVPPNLLHRAHAIAIIPNTIKAGFIVGGSYGEGVLLARQGDGWSDPVFIKLMGGSFGLQAGAQATDVILVFKTARSLEGLMVGGFTLGAAAGVAAGPVGRRVEGATDLQLQAEIYSYSRSSGLFAGVSLDGSALEIDHESNEKYYQQSGLTAEMIFTGQENQQPLAGKRLKMDLQEIVRKAGRQVVQRTLPEQSTTPEVVPEDP